MGWGGGGAPQCIFFLAFENNYNDEVNDSDY